MLVINDYLIDCIFLFVLVLDFILFNNIGNIGYRYALWAYVIYVQNLLNIT